MKNFSNQVANTSEVTKNQNKILVTCLVVTFLTVVNTAMLLALVAMHVK